MMKQVVIASIMATVIATPLVTNVELGARQAVNCPIYLPANNFEFPHLIVPISQAAPTAGFGNAYTPSVSPNDFATIFNFDIPTSRAGQTCSLWFSLPTQSQLVTTSFSYWGPGTFEFEQYQYGSGATAGTTWNTQPAPAADVSSVTLTQVAPGHAYKVWTGSCGQGGLLSWRMSSVDSCLWLFQDYNECAIGAYIVYG